MRVLLLTTKFSVDASSPWLTNELAEELRDSGNDVTVLCIDWSSTNKKGRVNVNGISAFIYPVVSCDFLPAPFRLVMKWFVSSLFAHLYFMRCLKGLVFDAVISFSPCVPVWFCILRLRRYAVRRIVIYWDFFPIHNFQIGKIRNEFFLKPAFLFEKYLLSKFNAAGCMSERNITFFKNYFSLGASVKPFELPIWGRRDLDTEEQSCTPLIDRTQFGYSKLLVFGGQLERGRGIDVLLELSQELSERDEDIALIIAGDGPLKSRVIDASQDGAHNLIYLGQLTRDDYLEFIRTCDIGVIATQMNVSVPTYPSKCIDYLLAPLPIIAVVEKSTDFGAIIQEAGCGLVCDNDSISEIADKVVCLAHDDLQMAEMQMACSTFFDHRHDVGTVVKRLKEELE